LIATLCTLVFTVPAMSENACWIDHVELEGTGVRVIFSDDSGNIWGTALPSRSWFVISHQQITWRSGPMKDQTERGVLLMEDESIGLTQGPEDNCTVKFAKAPHGVIAEATLNPPLSGDKPQSTTVFIPAQPAAR
jgi:hypothetical protein